MPKIVTITGMHRSGTSLTASWLQACGLQIDNGELIGPGAGNLKGHFEDKEFVNLHARIILEGNNNSRGWIESTKTYSFKEKDKKKVENLIKVRREYDQWGWKDPRTVLFLDDWVKLVPDMKFIFLWRPAYQVVNSLLERKRRSSNSDFKISKINGYKTWRHYNKQLINFQKKYPNHCILVNINKLVEADHDLYSEVSRKFDLNLFYSPFKGLFKEHLMKDRSFNAFDGLFYQIYGLFEIEKELDFFSFN